MDVGYRDELSTKAQKHTVDPVFEEGFVFIVNNPHTEYLHIRVIDSNQSTDKECSSSRLGELNIAICDILRLKMWSFQHYNPGC